MQTLHKGSWDLRYVTSYLQLAPVCLVAYLWVASQLAQLNLYHMCLTCVSRQRIVSAMVQQVTSELHYLSRGYITGSCKSLNW